ncbi:unnamed protein product [Schistosoma rodhaini]|nr:unnamed protein product [Schistosoma rodhaini]
MAKSEELVAELENTLKGLAGKWKSMEIKKEQSAEIEKDLEERLSVLTHHVKEAEFRADTAEAEVNRRLMEIKKAKERIITERTMYETLRKEMDTMINEFHSI